MAGHTLRVDGPTLAVDEADDIHIPTAYRQKRGSLPRRHIDL